MSKDILKKRNSDGWVQCNQCGNGYQCTQELWEVDHFPRMACGHCGVGFLSWEPFKDNRIFKAKLLLEKEYDWNNISDLSRHVDDLVDDPDFELRLQDGATIKVSITLIE